MPDQANRELTYFEQSVLAQLSDAKVERRALTTKLDVLQTRMADRDVTYERRLTEVHERTRMRALLITGIGSAVTLLAAMILTKIFG